uniref:Neural proliferation, differentiation and control, 1a n=1 Tax=Labrus bergylta TaxID=56723 RepID=A0A3Q3EFE2_9LABR|nr:neural proliferation differentiation and control protein 1-like isoform X2 [Labrus bergylta]
MLLSPRNGRQRRASLLLLLAVVVVCVVPVAASLPAFSNCPPPLDCANERREFCRFGSNHCGPCLPALVENDEGICQEKRRRHKQDKMSFPYLDEEIDYLHSVIEKQEISEIKPPKQRNKHPAAVVSQTNAKKSKTDASKHKQRSQGNLPNKTLQTTTSAPPLPVSELAIQTDEPGATAAAGRAGPVAVQRPQNSNFIILTSVFAAVGAIALVMAAVCYVKVKKESRLAQKVDYPAFKGGAGPPAATANGASMGDKTLAQSAQMYHYQHQKQQMLSVGNHKPEQKTVDTEVTSDEEEVGGDFTVYECPGLAPTGEMEVKNPLFDDSTLHYQENLK